MPVERIESSPIKNRYARGWHCLGTADEFKHGKPQTLNIFGTRLVAFRGASGTVSILDSYCPHMGADLSIGEVKGDSLICPFHHWAWSGEGKCVQIPYCKIIPPKAKVKSWPVHEQNKLFFVYNDPEGNPPPEEVAIPRIEACFSDGWTPWNIKYWLFNTNCRELIDNLADEAHFGAIHQAPNVFFANVFEGHKATQITIGTSETLTEGGLRTYNTYFGPAVHFTHMIADLQGHPLESILLLVHVPKDLNSFHQRFGVIVKKLPHLSAEQNTQIAEAYSQAVFDSFAQDQKIWDTKVRIDNPLLCSNDGPIVQLRKWYEQFYVDVAALSPEVQNRKVVTTINRNDLTVPIHHVFES
jgi:3-ketosteroid 9alpha-monooxygenase subunit A